VTYVAETDMHVVMMDHFIGILFNFTVILGIGIPFLARLSQSLSLIVLWNMEEYITFVMLSSLTAGLMFQFPVLLTALIKAGIVETDKLKENRLLAFGTIALISALITPTTDAVTMLLLAVPLFLMYELVIRINGKKVIRWRQNGLS